MSKVDRGKINWNAKTNWEFCGSYENLREVWNRHAEHVGVKFPIEEFGYRYPLKGLAFEKGDIVKYTPDVGEQVLGIVAAPVNNGGWFAIRKDNGQILTVHPDKLGECVAPAGIPDELMALARAEAAAASVDLSKCPLKKAGACMESE